MLTFLAKSGGSPPTDHACMCVSVSTESGRSLLLPALICRCYHYLYCLFIISG